MSLITNYIKKEDRALPVFILVDVSGSMQGQKIGAVNVALKEMINSFRKIENPKGVIELCILAFGNDEVKVIKPLSRVAEDDNYELDAYGSTPMGKCFENVADLIEDYSVVSSRAFTPTIVLISDGNPTDFQGYHSGMSIEEIMNWPSLTKLNSGTRSSKATRLAMGIGGDQDYNILKSFINNETIPVIKATETETISKFFDWVTMSISVRSVSSNPNKASILDAKDYFDSEDIEF